MHMCADVPPCVSQDAKSKLREIAEKRADDVDEVMAHLEKTLLKLCLPYVLTLSFSRTGPWSL